MNKKMHQMSYMDTGTVKKMWLVYISVFIE